MLFCSPRSQRAIVPTSSEHYLTRPIPFPFHRHKADADQIEKIAKDANDTSTKAYNLLMKTLDGENKMNKDIDDLNKKYVSSE